MLQKELTKEQVTHLGEQILEYMEGEVIEQGYQYFSDGKVFNIHVHEGALVTSDVQGSLVYHVAIDLNAFRNSNCSCPYSHFCKHLAATYFQICSVFENPKNFLHLASQPRSTRFSTAILYPTIKRRNKKPTSELFLRSPLAEDSTVHDWYRFLHNWTRNLSLDMEKHRLFSELRTNYEKVLMITSSWNEERAQLFTIHAILYHLQKLDEYADQLNTSTSSHLWHELQGTAEQFIEQLEGTLYYLNLPKVQAEQHDYFAATIAKVKELKHWNSSAINWILVNQMLWWYLFTRPTLYSQELHELETALQDPELSETENKRYQLLKTHFAVIEGNDEAALQVWSRYAELSPPTFVFYVKALARQNEWLRLVHWFEHAVTLVQKAEGQNYRVSTAIWRHALDQVGRAEEWGSVLQRILPRSFAEYSSYLFEQNKYKQWLDLQMANGVTYLEIESFYTKQIEEENPSLLLPLYVREINRLINVRSRNSYREAIKLLKKVRTWYHDTNQDDRWKHYIEQLSGKYNRLRAFQEELRRGNLFT